MSTGTDILSWATNEMMYNDSLSFLQQSSIILHFRWRFRKTFNSEVLEIGQVWTEQMLPIEIHKWMNEDMKM